MSITRRQILEAAAAATPVALAASSPFCRPAPPLKSLAQIAADHGVLFGTAFDTGILNPSAFAELYFQQARIFTTNNFLKFGSVRFREDGADFSQADRLIDHVLRRGMQVRGHNLIWNDWTPDWLQKSSSGRIAYWLEKHVEETVTRYAGRFHSWDVVNEPLWLAHGHEGGYRNGPWFAALGASYIAKALKTARAADPNVKLVINECGPEWQKFWVGMDGAKIRTAFLQLIDDLQHAGVPLDAIGLQCHWMPEFEFSVSAFEDLLSQLARRKLKIYLTELDVSDARFKGDMAQRDHEVARRYAVLISAALRFPEVEVIQTWELSDNATWLRVEPFLGPEGRLPRPLPFDDELQPKAAYYALARAFESPRARRT